MVLQRVPLRKWTIHGIEEKIALKEINKTNKRREKHYNYYTDQKWKDMNNYDFSINVDALGVEKTAEIISEIVKEKCGCKK